jgi:hypothetical protein
VAVCYSSIKGLAMRATRLNSAGEWEDGATASVVSKGFINISLSANIDEGEEFLVKNANGELCINEKDQSRLKYMDLEIEFCEVSPELFELMTGVRLLSDAASGDSIGFTMAEELQAAPHALEVWTKVTGGDGSYNWVYWLLPRVVNGIAGDFTVENGPMSFTLSANTMDNANWGSGPYDVVKDALGVAAPLNEAVLAGEHVYHRLTDVTPPTAVCGYVTQPVAYTP